MPRTTALDLPWELLSIIVEDSIPEKVDYFTIKGSPGDESQPRRSHYSRLSRVCRALHDFFTPYIWRDVYIMSLSKLVQFYKALDPNPKTGERVLTLEFDIYWSCFDHAQMAHQMRTLADIEELQMTDSVDIRGQLMTDSLDINGQQMTICSMIQEVLYKLPCLKKLSIRPGEDLYDASFTWPFDLSNNKAIETLHIYGLRCNPEHVLEFLSLKHLNDLLLWNTFRRDAWERPIELPLRQTNATKLTLYNNESEYSHYIDWWSLSGRAKIFSIPNHVAEDFLACFDRIEDLTLMIQHHSFIRRDIESMLVELAQRTELKTLKIVARELLENKWGKYHLEIDFSTWKHLQHLEFDSHIFWLVRNGWDRRDDLHKLLPSTLRSLTVHFPYHVKVDWVDQFDGAFQLNANLIIWPDEHEMAPYHDQVIPLTRYNWIINLSSVKDDKNIEGSVLLPRLPCLSKITIREDRIVGPYDRDNSGVSMAPFRLPDEIGSSLCSRGIKFDCEVKRYPDLPAYEDYYDFSDEYNFDAQSEQSYEEDAGSTGSHEDGQAS